MNNTLPPLTQDLVDEYNTLCDNGLKPLQCSLCPDTLGMNEWRESMPYNAVMCCNCLNSLKEELNDFYNRMQRRF